MSEFAVEAPPLPGSKPGQPVAAAPAASSQRGGRVAPGERAPRPPSSASSSSLGTLPLPAALTVALVSGLALAAAFPSLGWWPAAPLALGGIFLVTRGRRARAAAGLGAVAGLAFYLPHLHWSGVYVGLLPWSALATLETLYLVAMCALAPLAWRAPGGRAGTVAALTGLWVAQEGLRSRTPFGGFPWARTAFSQADAPTLGYAALGGAPLVSAAVAAAGACLALAAADLLRRRATDPFTTTPAATTTAGTAPPALSAVLLRRVGPALLAAIAVLGGGALVPRPAGPDGAGPATGTAGAGTGRTVQVAAVQGDVPEPGLEFNAERRAVLDNHAGATLRLAEDVAAGRAPRPDVVLWPENSSDIDPLRNPDAAEVISRAADAIGVPVLVGAVLAGPEPNLSNAAILWGPAGSAEPGPGQRYVKRHPAPFAEYIPYRSFFRIFSDKVDLVRTDFAPGRTVGVLQSGPVRLGSVICFEVAYDDLVRDTVNAGADLLVVQTNNATFGFTDESVQQLAMSRLRAVETGRSVVHVSTVGVSALITPDGREVARSGHFTAEVLQAGLPLRTTRTVATRVGAAPEAGLGLLGVLLAGWAGVRASVARRRGRTAPAGGPARDAGPAEGAGAEGTGAGGTGAEGTGAAGSAAVAGGTGPAAGAGAAGGMVFEGEESQAEGRDRGQESPT